MTCGGADTGQQPYIATEKQHMSLHHMTQPESSTSGFPIFDG